MAGCFQFGISRHPKTSLICSGGLASLARATSVPSTRLVRSWRAAASLLLMAKGRFLETIRVYAESATTPQVPAGLFFGVTARLPYRRHHSQDSKQVLNEHQQACFSFRWSRFDPDVTRPESSAELLNLGFEFRRNSKGTIQRIKS